jgi:hypothetical protein
LYFQTWEKKLILKSVLDLGVSEYLVKANFTLDELAEKIKAIIGK